MPEEPSAKRCVSGKFLIDSRNSSSASNTNLLQPSIESPDLVVSVLEKGVTAISWRVPYRLVFFLKMESTRSSSLKDRRLDLSIIDTSDFLAIASFGKVSKTQDPYWCPAMNSRSLLSLTRFFVFSPTMPSWPQGLFQSRASAKSTPSSRRAQSIRPMKSEKT